MKLRDSGMPDEVYWESLMRPVETIERLGLADVAGDVVEFGCGYGTFTLHLAAEVQGTVWTYDIEPEMVARVGERAAAAGVVNIVAERRDLFESGTGRPAGTAAVVTIFNLLHGEEPERLLAEARRVLAREGVLAVSHWVWDAATPRGPDLAIRPRPAALRAMCEAAGFTPESAVEIALPPYHYGWRCRPTA